MVLDSLPKCVFTIAYSIRSWYFKVTIPKVITSTLSSKYLRYVAGYKIVLYFIHLYCYVL